MKEHMKPEQMRASSRPPMRWLISAMEPIATPKICTPVAGSRMSGASSSSIYPSVRLRLAGWLGRRLDTHRGGDEGGHAALLHKAGHPAAKDERAVGEGDSAPPRVAKVVRAAVISPRRPAAAAAAAAATAREGGREPKGSRAGLANASCPLRTARLRADRTAAGRIPAEARACGRRLTRRERSACGGRAPAGNPARARRREGEMMVVGDDRRRCGHAARRKHACERRLRTARRARRAECQPVAAAVGARKAPVRRSLARRCRRDVHGRGACGGAAAWFSRSSGSSWTECAPEKAVRRVKCAPARQLGLTPTPATGRVHRVAADRRRTPLAIAPCSGAPRARGEASPTRSGASRCGWAGEDAADAPSSQAGVLRSGRGAAAVRGVVFMTHPTWPCPHAEAARRRRAVRAERPPSPGYRLGDAAPARWRRSWCREGVQVTIIIIIIFFFFTCIIVLLFIFIFIFARRWPSAAAIHRARWRSPRRRPPQPAGRISGARSVGSREASAIVVGRTRARRMSRVARDAASR
eukprot:scaffold225_cov388-Prasinococcus_capsulatus_cf.AAC.51